MIDEKVVEVIIPRLFHLQRRHLLSIPFKNQCETKAPETIILLAFCFHSRRSFEEGSPKSVSGSSHRPVDPQRKTEKTINQTVNNRNNRSRKKRELGFTDFDPHVAFGPLISIRPIHSFEENAIQVPRSDNPSLSLLNHLEKEERGEIPATEAMNRMIAPPVAMRSPLYSAFDVCRSQVRGSRNKDEAKQKKKRKTKPRIGRVPNSISLSMRENSSPETVIS